MEEIASFGDPDCYLHGDVTSNHGSASLHCCNGIVSSILAGASKANTITFAPSED